MGGGKRAVVKRWDSDDVTWSGRVDGGDATEGEWRE